MYYRTYKYRFYPSENQEFILNKTFQACCFIWNWALEYKNNAYKVNKLSISYNKINAILTQNKKEENFKWITEISSVPIQQQLRRLEKSFSNFFKKKFKYPKFKKNVSSIEYNKNGFLFKNNNLFIAKCKEPLNVVWSRKLPSDPKSLIIVKEPNNKWFVCFLVKIDKKENINYEDKNVGIDLGIKTLATLSDGKVFENPKYFSKYQKKLARAQRKLSKKKKGSKNRNKQMIKVAQIHSKIKNSREDRYHKITTEIVKENTMIAMEDLNILGMVKNYRLAKNIMDCSFGKFKNFIQYKCIEYNKELIIINRWFPSSKLCSVCGVINESLKLSDRIWTCSCGNTHDRDLNASKNILTAGLVERLNDCGDGVSRQKKISFDASIYEPVNSSLQKLDVLSEERIESQERLAERIT